MNYLQINWWIISLFFLQLIIMRGQAGISYQSVSFVHGPSRSRQFHPLAAARHPPPSHVTHHLHSPHFPITSPSLNFFDDALQPLQHSLRNKLWPTNLFQDPVDFLDITLNSHHPGGPHSFLIDEHEHDFLNKLELPPDPYLLTGHQAKQAANYLYSHELFFKDIPHARALLKLQEKRLANGLRPNRLGSLNIRSPFNRDHSRHFDFK